MTTSCLKRIEMFEALKTLFRYFLVGLPRDNDAAGAPRRDARLTDVITGRLNLGEKNNVAVSVAEALIIPPVIKPNRRSVRIGIVPPLELVTCSHVFSPQLPLNQTCKLSSPNKKKLQRISLRRR